MPTTHRKHDLSRPAEGTREAWLASAMSLEDGRCGNRIPQNSHETPSNNNIETMTGSAFVGTEHTAFMHCIACNLPVWSRNQQSLLHHHPGPTHPGIHASTFGQPQADDYCFSQRSPNLVIDLSPPARGDKVRHSTIKALHSVAFDAVTVKSTSRVASLLDVIPSRSQGLFLPVVQRVNASCCPSRLAQNYAQRLHMMAQALSKSCSSTVQCARLASVGNAIHLLRDRTMTVEKPHSRLPSYR